MIHRFSAPFSELLLTRRKPQTSSLCNRRHFDRNIDGEFLDIAEGRSAAVTWLACEWKSYANFARLHSVSSRRLHAVQSADESIFIRVSGPRVMVTAHFPQRQFQEMFSPPLWTFFVDQDDKNRESSSENCLPSPL
jgi:hypothetical protein